MPDEKKTCAGTHDLPFEIQRSLLECGGIEGLTNRMPDNNRIKEICTLHRALADENRMKILLMLSSQPLCVCVIRNVLDIADSKLSYHLSVLKKNGLIFGEQQGNWIIYSLTDKGVSLLP